MTHYRTGLAILVVVYALQCVGVLQLDFSPGAAIAESFVGLLIAGRVLTTTWRRVITGEGSITLAGFFIGYPRATISAADLVSIRYRAIQQAVWGRPAFEFALFELHGQTSPNYFPISRFGWSANRLMFREILEIVENSSAQVDERTLSKLRSAAGLRGDSSERSTL